MREYFTIMVKENDMANLKLLTEKLNEGFRIDDRFEVGRSTVVTLRRHAEIQELARAVPTGLSSSYASENIPF